MLTMEHEDRVEEIEPAPDVEAAEEVLPPRASRMRDPKLRQVATTSTSRAPAWWVGLTPSQFQAAADWMADELKGSKEAAKVPTKLNFL